MAFRPRPGAIAGTIKPGSTDHPWSGLLGQLIIVAILLASAAWILYPLRERAVQDNRLRQTQGRVDYEQTRRSRLTYDTRQLRENPGYIESVARANLGVVRQGEVAYVVLDQRPRSKAKLSPKAPRGLLERVREELGARF